MKRAVSIGLLLVLLVTAMQPTLAFHFCGGSLHSVGIGSAGRMCCGGEMDAAPTGEASLAGTIALSESAEPCCSGYTLDIATDTYQIPSALPTVPVLPPMDFLPPSCFPCSIADDYELSALSLPTAFPPGISTQYTSDRLALICVWRK
ncbi:MAG: hypothetical protein LBS88_00085 [Tannerellaceae bacterium]|jgi:hypothetical protein|nr:hypothetical protein [Tannerellaceae bacterium]